MANEEGTIIEEKMALAPHEVRKHIRFRVDDYFSRIENEEDLDKVLSETMEEEGDTILIYGIKVGIAEAVSKAVSTALIDRRTING